MKIEKTYIPYRGKEGYLYLAFSDGDEKRVKELMQGMYMRNIRFWYFTGKGDNINELNYFQSRMNDASLVVLFLTKNYVSDTSAKGSVLYLLSKKVPLIIYEADEGISSLEIGVPESTPRCDNLEELIRCEGFSYDLISEKRMYKIIKPGVKYAAAALIAAALVAAGSFIYAKCFYVDPGEMTEIKLKKLPDDISELSAYPKLEKVIIPKSLAEDAGGLMEKYTVVIVED